MKEPNRKMTGKRLEYQEKIEDGALWFVWIALLSLGNSIFLFIGTNFGFMFGLAITQFIDIIGINLSIQVGPAGKVIAFIINLLIAVIISCFGFIAKKGYRLAFIVGMITYALDGILALLLEDYFGAAFHCVPLYFIFMGFKVCNIVYQAEKDIYLNSIYRSNLITIILGVVLSVPILFASFLQVDSMISASKPMSNLYDLSDFVSYYYLNPQPELITDAIELIVKQGYTSNENIYGSMMGFFTYVFSHNEDRREEWLNVINKQDDKTKEFFLEAMDTNIEELISKTEISPILNDMYWGAFFASGDVSYIDKLIDKLQYINERENKDLFLAAGTAKWSLGSNALFHPKVKAAIEELKTSDNPELRKLAEDMLNSTPEELIEEIITILEEQHDRGIW